MGTIILSIIGFLLGGFIGILFVLFVASIGDQNKISDSYSEGFMDGYTKGRDEK